MARCFIKNNDKFNFVKSNNKIFKAGLKFDIYLFKSNVDLYHSL